MAPCPDQHALDAFCAGTMPAAAAAAVDEHMRSCRRCAAWMRGAGEEDERVLQSLRALGDAGPASRPGGADDTTRTAPPRAIAGFRILRQIGEGGMGVVFAAEQHSPQREVALKIVRPGAASERALRRLEQEAQVLARLQHPGIAQIHEAGVFATEDGPQPFFAMQLVHGKPLLQHATDAALGLRDRLALLVKICAAVHHAHQRGVIHRDLKPSNILVDADGQPVVLDFGVARLRDETTDALTLSTHTGQIIGTVPYMSPEQLGGDPGAIDVRCDVWALGVIGYQLVTGRLPLDLEGKPFTAALRIVREQRPAPLRSLDRRLAGDLDTIFATALEPDPARRYAAASELQGDLERYLASRPITARPPGTLYTLGLWMRRHKAWTAAALLVIGVSIAAFVVTARQMLLAQQARATAEAVNDFFADLLSFGAAYERRPNPDFTMREAIERADALIDDLADQPAAEASVRFMIGTAYQSLQMVERAEEQFERVLALRLAVLGARHPDVGEVTNQLAMLAEARGDLELAARRYREALDIYRAAQGPQGSWVGRILANLGSNARRRGDLDAARARLEQAVAVLDACPDAERFLAVSCSHLAYVRMQQGATGAAEELYRRSLAVANRAGKARHAYTAFTTVALGQLLVSDGRPEEAEPLLLEALDTVTAALGAGHPQAVRVRAVVVDFYRRRGQVDRAAEIEAAGER